MIRFDQSFSAENFRRIWDLRTRSGENLVRMFPATAEAAGDVRLARNTRRETLKLLGRKSPFYDATREAQTTRVEEAVKKLGSATTTVVSTLGEQVNSRIDRGDFSVGIRVGDVIRGKQTYRVDLKDPLYYFIVRQVERNLREAFDIEPSNRNLVTEQLFRTLDDTTSKLVVRTDIKQCYESIPHDRLLQLLRDSTSLSRTTYRFVESILREYEAIVGDPIGLPRGMGLSAALAEIYLTQLDDRFRDLPEVILYVRYVDDVVVVFAATSNNAPLAQRQKLIRGCAKAVGLRLNPSKTRYILLPSGRLSAPKFTFLGYEFTCAAKGTTVDISSRRRQKIVNRLELSFARYSSLSHLPRSSYLLVNRVRFLTGNTRLAHNKRHAVVGIYFSNSLLPGASSRLKALDKRLGQLLATTPMPPSLRDQLDLHSFVDGYRTRRFHQFSGRELRRIVAVWKHA